MARGSAGKQPQKRQSRRQERPDFRERERQEEEQYESTDRPVMKRDTAPIHPMNNSQTSYLGAMKSSVLTFGTGPAGTGKTWLCVALAAEMLDSGLIEKIIITRPAVEAGENLGFLPGELEEKFDPYLQPFRDVLHQRLGKGYAEYLIKRGVIEAAPLAYMRGRTFKDAFVILDEAQNTTPVQMKMFLTRIGHNAKVVVNGDIGQKDINGMSGLEDAINKLAWIPSIRSIKFSRKDIVRSGLVQEIVEAYETNATVPHALSAR